MSTGNKNLLFKSKCVNLNDCPGRYSNLNLNQNNKSPREFCFVQCSNKSKDRFENSFEENEIKDSWSKSANNRLCWENTDSFNLLFATEEKKQKCRQNDDNLSANRSTLSLHIAAYEEATESDVPKDPLVKLQKSFSNTFEFPRQMEEDERRFSEIMQFRASQSLLNPNIMHTETNMEPAIPAEKLSLDALWKIKKNDLIKLKHEKLWSNKFNIPCLPGIKYDFGIFMEEKVNKDLKIVFRVDKSKLDHLEADICFSIEAGNLTKNCKGVLNQSKDYRIEQCLGPVDEIFDSENMFFVNGEMELKIFGFLTYCISPVYFSQHPMFLEYKIERKNLEALNVNEYQEFPFRIAEISDAQFYVRIYRVTDASHGKICISFGARCEEEIKFSARLRIILQSSKCCMKSSNILPPFCSPGADGRIICCSMADLINLESAPNEQITLKIDGFLIYERKAPKFNAFKLPKQIVPSVFYNKYFHQNIEIFAGGNNTPILMLKRVAAAFAQSLIDAVEDDSTVNIPEFPYEIVETAVKLLNGYSSSCRTFSFENMLVLLHFACSYNIASIKDEVSSFIMKSISPANCAHIFLFSKFIKLENIRAKSVQYLKALAAESKAFSYAEILSDEDKEEIYGASNA